MIRVGPDDWPLRQQAAERHGSYQAALLAGLRSLTSPAAGFNLDEEIRAREAAKLLGLTTGTVAGYIRNGRIPGRYDDPPTWLGWVTTRRAVEAHRSRTRSNG